MGREARPEPRENWRIEMLKIALVVVAAMMTVAHELPSGHHMAVKMDHTHKETEETNATGKPNKTPLAWLVK